MLGQSIAEDEERGRPQQQPPTEWSVEWQWHADHGNSRRWRRRDGSTG